MSHSKGKSTLKHKSTLIKLALLVALLLMIVVFFSMGLQRYLTLEQLRASQSTVEQLLQQNPVVVAAVFFALYVLVTALSLPGAAIMTLAAGAIFGLVQGTLLASFASSIGASLAFLTSRYLLRNPVQKRFSERLKKINSGIENDGAFYLFTLRLVPLFPFFVINLVMGLTPIRTWTFYWVSQLGMLAGTLVYVNAGTQLASIERVGDIFSPALLISFVFLAAFPWLAKAIIGYVRRRRLYQGWSRPKRFDRNLIVIGAGAAGLVTAYIAAAVKAKVTLVEAHKMGGDCLHYGCMPSKTLIKSAKVAHQIRHSGQFGIQTNRLEVNFSAVMQRIAQVIKTIEPHDSVERYTGLGVDVVMGYAKILDPWTVQIQCNDGTTRRLSTRSIVIAAGAQPVVPALPGLEACGYVTSDTLWQKLAERDQPPARLVVLGGGPVGCELAQAFARLGSRVIQIEHGDRLLKREDQEVSIVARNALEADGVEVLTGHTALRCERLGQQKFIIVEHGGKERRLEFDDLLCALGRRARLNGYGLEALGVPVERTVCTNEYLETLYPNIFAAGDVAGPFQFTHTASHMAWYAAVNALFGSLKRFKVDYSVIPWTTFIDPEIARVGLNEQDAQAQGIAYEISRFELSGSDRALAEGATAGFVKVLTVPGRDKILGVILVGEHAGELLAEFVLAMRHGLGLNKIMGTIHTYPTMAESNKSVAGVWKKAHAPQRLLHWVARYHRWQRGGGA